MNAIFQSAADIDEQRTELIDRMTAIVDVAKSENRDLSADEEADIDRIQAELPKLDSKHDRQTKVEAYSAKRAGQKADQLAVPQSTEETDALVNAVKLPATARKPRNLKCFGNEFETAYGSGMWLAARAGNHKARQWCFDHGWMNAMSEGTDSAGGYTVPSPLAEMIIRLVEEYGIARQYLRVVPMTSETLDVPRRTGGLTVYYPGEAAAITASDLTFAQATLTAKKYAAYAIMSTELAEDSVISMADLVATEIAYAFAVAEDTNTFTGDGSAGMGSVTGFENALQAGSIYDADSGETSVTDLDFADYEGVMGLLPRYPGARNAWFVNSKTFATSMQSLMNAAGGNTISDLEAGSNPRFLGYPVVISQVLPDDGASNVVAYFGDLSMAATMGTRRALTIQTLRELLAVNDQIGIIATQRNAVTVHEVGDGSNAGPVVGLKLAAS